jgi:hypothetical protein
MRVLALLFLLGCDGLIDVAVKGEADYGQVFVCKSGCTTPDGWTGYEWCFDGDAQTLSELKGDSCREISVNDRLWPALVGCAYDCSGRLKGPGANAHCGTYCP